MVVRSLIKNTVDFNQVALQTEMKSNIPSGSHFNTPLLCPNCPCGNILFFIIDGKCHKCGCVID